MGVVNYRPVMLLSTSAPLVYADILTSRLVLVTKERALGKPINLPSIIALVLVSYVSESTTITAADELKNMTESPFWVPPEFGKVEHPITHTRPGFGLGNLQLTSIEYKKLNDFFNSKTVSSSYYHHYWSLWFTKVEEECARKFCKSALGLQTNEITKLAGKPRCKSPQVNCWKWAKGLQEVWIYGFGATDKLVWLEIKDGKCVKSGLATKEQYFQFQEWRANEISKFARGKRLWQIIATLGLPTSVRDNQNRELQPAEYPLASKAWYQTGISFSTELTIEHGNCTKSETGLIFH